MTTVIIIGIIISVIYASSSKKKATYRKSTYISYNRKQQPARAIREELVQSFLKDKELVQSTIKDIKVNAADSISSTNFHDDSIIDVTNQTYNINSNSKLKKYNNGVPYWAHHYVYSYSEINSASIEQKRFYQIFRTSFLNGESFDLEGNTNYAFILLFDLLNEYKIHKDLVELEIQLKVLGQCYPKTKSYAVSFLIQKMETGGDIEGLLRLRKEERYSYQHNTDYDYWKLGNKYKATLSLNDEEVKLLNKLWYQNNNFCGIEYCWIEILKLYLSVVSELKSKYIQEGTTIDTEFLAVADVIARKHFRYKTGSQNYKYCLESMPNEFHSHIFKHCENKVREYYGHKRKVNTDMYYTNEEVKAEYETKIVTKVVNLLSILISKVALPNEATEIELYAQNTNRWKIKFEELTTNYSGYPKTFIESIISLGRLNKKNPSIENIFFEASKFIAKYDKEAALSLYVHYLYHDLQSATFDNKKLTKTIQKSLFETNEQLHDFEKSISKLIEDRDLDKALKSISKVYEVKRKRIQLDSSSIKEVQQKHSGTVELLNEYLKDDFEDEYNSIKSQEISNQEIKIEIIQKNENVKQAAFTVELPFTIIHIATLELFAKNNFSIHQNEIEVFARSTGIFKNQLIDSINEICYDFLDDLLIEEEDDYYYTINTNYFQRISTR